MTRLGLSREEKAVYAKMAAEDAAQKKLDNLTGALVENILNTSDEEILAEVISPTQMAYALLWRSSSDSSLTHCARKVLLGALSHAEQRQAIAWVLALVGPMSDREMIAADMRAGVFPRRSAPEAQS